MVMWTTNKRERERDSNEGEREREPWGCVAWGVNVVSGVGGVVIGSSWKLTEVNLFP